VFACLWVGADKPEEACEMGVVVLPVRAGPAEAGTPTWVAGCGRVGLWVGEMGGESDLKDPQSNMR